MTVDGSFYLDDVNHDFWLHEGGVWVLKGNIGPNGSCGNGVPTTFPNGLYIDILTSNIYENGVLQGTLSGGGGIGATGAQGIPGAPGTDGADGQDGQQGPPGLNGAQGAQGTPGSNAATLIMLMEGNDGTDGDFVPGPQGNVGPQGPQGNSGLNGASFIMLQEGNDGTDGDFVPGPQGNVGAQGQDGGLKYLLATAGSIPGAGQFSFDNATFASATTLSINKLDNLGNDLTGLFGTFGTFSSANKVLVTIYKQGGGAVFVFNITSGSAPVSGVYNFNITPLASGGAISTGDVCHILFSPIGDKGATGATGPQGAQGPPGADGADGQDGDKGPVGDKGATGATGTVTAGMSLQWITTTTGTTVPSGVATSLTWPVQQTDNSGGQFDGTTFTPTKTGSYLISFTIGLSSAVPAATTFQLWLGTSSPLQNLMFTQGSVGSLVGLALAPLSGGSSYTFRLVQSSGVAVTMQAFDIIQITQVQ